jgi:DNA repair protein RecO (recombination protein O)
MLRTFSVEGFVFLTDRFGEIHKRVTLFTAEQGLLSVIAHGAYKTTGKLKSHTELFLHGKFYIYRDPVKDSSKITDAECLHSFPGLRKSVVRYYAASLFAEIVLQSFGGGEGNPALFALVREALIFLDDLPEAEVPLLVAQFISRFLHIVGFEIDASSCAICSRVFSEKESAYFLRRGRGFVCKDCRKEAALEFSPGSRAFLKKTGTLSLAEACKVRLASSAFIQLKSLLFVLVQESIEKELNSLVVGKGVL